MEFIFEYGLFLAKTVTILASVLVVVVTIVGMSHRPRRSERGHIEVHSLNDNVEAVTHLLKQVVMNPEAHKLQEKAEKKTQEGRT